MLIADVIFWIVLFCAPPLLGFALYALLREPRLVWSTLLGALLGTAMGACFVIFWIAWGRAFDYADATRPVPGSLDRTQDVCLVLFALSYVAFVVTTVVKIVLTRQVRERSSQVV